MICNDCGGSGEIQGIMCPFCRGRGELIFEEIFAKILLEIATISLKKEAFLRKRWIFKMACRPSLN